MQDAVLIPETRRNVSNLLEQDHIRFEIREVRPGPLLGLGGSSADVPADHAHNLKSFPAVVQAL
jgi:hypothetical protein